MGNYLFRLIKSVVFWEYERGTWQYDLLVTLILVLLFFSPRGFSRSWIHLPRQPAATANPTVVPPDESRHAEPRVNSTVQNATEQRLKTAPAGLP